MKRTFSKPLTDVAREFRAILDADAELNAGAARSARALVGRPSRTRCTVCAADPLSGEEFIHRGLEYVTCASCGQVLSKAEPPGGHPAAAEPGQGFETIYPPLPPEERARRKERVYRPKLDWLLDGAEAAGIPRVELLARPWLELGCGEGLFLEALADAGATDILGIDANAQLAARAEAALGPGRARAGDAPLHETLAASDAGAYAAFFVLEHAPDVHAFFSALAAKPKGTLFAFSVPVFGLATMLESAFDAHYPRNLDGAVHTQLFTDRSIARCLDAAGCEPVAEWVFGQDASDFRRLMLLRLRAVYGPAMLDAAAEALSRLEDPLQQALDRSGLADSRHILAVRR